MKKTVTWLLPVKLALFLFIQSFNAFILLTGTTYLHPDFTTGYLAGKEELFLQRWFPTGLYVHAFSAPIALLLVSLLVIFRLENVPKWHRALGKVTLLILAICVVPSGWILSYFALGGSMGKFVFFLLSSYTGFTALQAYWAAKKRQFTEHKRWMHEVLALLLSAVILRLLLVLFTLLEFNGDTAYITAALLSWVPSIVVLKLWRIQPKSA